MLINCSVLCTKTWDIKFYLRFTELGRCKAFRQLFIVNIIKLFLVNVDVWCTWAPDPVVDVTRIWGRHRKWRNQLHVATFGIYSGKLLVLILSMPVLNIVNSQFGGFPSVLVQYMPCCVVEVSLDTSCCSVVFFFIWFTGFCCEVSLDTGILFYFSRCAVDFIFDFDFVFIFCCCFSFSCRFVSFLD